MRFRARPRVMVGHRREAASTHIHTHIYDIYICSARRFHLGELLSEVVGHLVRVRIRGS